MKIAIFSGGPFSSVKIYPYDKLVCADKGYLYAQKLSLTPDVVVGDFDSLEFIPPSSEVYPCDKNYSDTEIATKKAISLGATEIDYYFCLGGRLDHELFNINLLKLCNENGVSARIVDANQTVYLLTQQDKIKQFTAKPGTFASFVPQTESVTFKSSTGLKYSLSGIKARIGQTVTLSNVVTSGVFTAEIDDGETLVIINE